MTTRTAAWLPLVGLILSAPFADADETRVALETRPGVTQNFVLSAHPEPKASVILFAGGPGVLGLSGPAESPGFGEAKNNFLVRSRSVFRDEGFTVAVVDAPSDRQGGDGMEGGFRSGEAHGQDIAAVVRYLKSRAPVPVWLVGTSRGTESAANCAIRLGAAVDGLVLTSTITRADRKGGAVTDLRLDRIRIPALVLSHRDDGCAVTPPSDTSRLLAGLSHAVRKEARLLTGGDPPKSKPCQALSPHGFLGIEAQVVHEIGTFIKAGSGR